MRIAIARQRYNPFGGAERFVDRALAALAREGAEVTLIARQWAGSVEACGGYQLLTCAPPYRTRVGRDRGFAACVQAAMGEGHFDLVQSHERIPGCTLYRAGDGVHAAWLEHRARVLPAWKRWAQYADPYHRYLLRAEREMFEHPDLRAVICNSRLVQDEIVARFGLPREKLPIIRNGVDLQAFHPSLAERYRQSQRAAHGMTPEETVFLYVGSGFERKGVPQLLRAFAALNAPARLVVVGADRHLEGVKRLARDLGIAPRTLFTGPVTDVKPWYGAADVFVLPTLYDPFPNAALEAMACGLPVVTSRECGLSELIEPGRNGFVLDALDISAWSETLAWLANATNRAPMGEQARAAVAGLSLESLAEELLTLYRQLLMPQNGGGRA